MKNNDKEISYTYDRNGNIETIKSEGKLIKYHYNSLNEVIREDNEPLGKTIVYNYDVGGNITSKTEYEYNASQKLGKEIKNYNYAYGDSNWKDKLTSFDGKEITYDQIGNPLTYDGYNFTWEHGRRLKSIKGNNKNISYKYNDSGIRTEKNVNGEVTRYHLNGSNVAYEETLDSTGKVKDSIYYNYDSSNHLVSMTLNGEEYFYIRNAQNDIIALTDKSGQQVVTYSYDTWGKLISIEGSLKESVGIRNPYRYRGYRYDEEIGLYYLQSRYYNPSWGRFINADGIIGTLGELISGNMFAYCTNNPVNMRDDVGLRPKFNNPFQTETSNMEMFSRKKYVKNIMNSVKRASLKPEGKPNSVAREYDKNGKLKKERWYGPDGRAVKDKHYTDHGNPKKHPKVPHEHDWGIQENGKWEPGPLYSTPSNEKVKLSIGIVGGTYLMYRGVRMIPSLLPPFWWTIPANIVAP